MIKIKNENIFKYYITMEATYHYKWGYYIKVYDGKYPSSSTLLLIKWENLSFELFCKYKWFFEYKYALLRIKYPKHLIEKNQFKIDLNAEEKKDLLKNRIIGKKRTITKYKNKLSLAEKHWNQLFPISEDDMYKKAVIKIERLESELQNLLNN